MEKDGNGSRFCFYQMKIHGEYLLWLHSSLSNLGLKFSSNSFSLKEVKFLAEILKNKFDLIVSIHKTGAINQYNIYISKTSIPKLIKIVKSYIHPTMLYKIEDLF